VWYTPNIESQVAYIARVSNPNNQDNPQFEKLLQYMIKHQHWSPFEMVNICMEIVTTRDIARQILRHRSFTFQEFSQRYAQATGFEWAEARLQDETNRQNSIEVTDPDLHDFWHMIQSDVLHVTKQGYDAALRAGVAKEVARKLLPEGLTVSKMYMNGSLRSWMHYVTLRTGPETQKEHRDVASKARKILEGICPTIMRNL
jgi:thymidylate synthase (FAD)